jgi:hypothetical protein
MRSRSRSRSIQIALLTGILSITSLSLSATEVSSTDKTPFITYLAKKVAELIKPESYDYKDYSFNGLSKTFKLTGNFCGDTETRGFSKTVVGDNTEIKMSRVRTSLGTTCHNKTFTRLATPTAMLLIDKENNKLSGTHKSTDTLHGPVPLRTSTMEMGSTFGTSSKIVRTSVGGAFIQEDLMVNTATLLGIEDVTVPAGSYSACLKIHTLRTSSTFGRFNRVQWFCAGIGEVKRMQSEGLGVDGYRIWELTSAN